jgi:hypothetical protein
MWLKSAGAQRAGFTALTHIAQHFRAEKKVRLKIREIHNGRFKA